MHSDNNIKLTSAEISQLWSAYMSDSLAICVLKYFLEKAEDPEIRPVVEYALKLAQAHIEKLTLIFNDEKFPIPYGFNEEDVDLTAPRLFSDAYFLYYLQQWSSLGLISYSLALSLASRTDVFDYFSECTEDSKKLLKKTRNILLTKGLYIRAPYVTTPEKVDFIQKQNFLTGWFGERRALTTLEVSNLHANLQRNVLAKTTFIGFSQVAKSKEVARFITRGKEIASKHIEIYSSILIENDIPASVSWDNQVLNSTVSPFSDKLMLFHVNALAVGAIGYYGTSLSTSSRRDLSTHYLRILGEVLKYIEDAANIMIENGWMEQPPKVMDHDKLANN
ncbi:DUF3231 family protein [Robertmurraya korlensis]|uniref:DUF3231 family protein n=1 Tax=Robertmurraya korlensis TaxID=519977 RepID=UPI00203F9D0C|nr:DUF3231 family protein [Robertmurraya korlensis]MCM3602790.1 DUF3231 family protein [Robertmurraya korlensis]